MIGSRARAWHGPNGCVGCIGGTLVDHPAGRPSEDGGRDGGRGVGCAGRARRPKDRGAACFGWVAALGLPGAWWVVGTRARGDGRAAAAVLESVVAGAGVGVDVGVGGGFSFGDSEFTAATTTKKSSSHMNTEKQNLTYSLSHCECHNGPVHSLQKSYSIIFF